MKGKKLVELKIRSIKGTESTLEIEADEKEFLSLKGESGRGRKLEPFDSKDPFKGIKDNETLKNVVRLYHFLKMNKLHPAKMTFKTLLEITSLYLEILKEKRVNPSTGRMTLNYSQVTYNYAYAVWYLSH